jgi:septum site-determining protein MinC
LRAFPRCCECEISHRLYLVHFANPAHYVGMSNESAKAIEIQGVMTALHVLRVLTPEISAIAAALDRKLAQLPSFFSNAPVAIDLRDLEPEDGQPRSGSGRLRLGPLADLLRTRGLVPVAIRGGVPARIEEARTLGLGVLEWDRASAAKKSQRDASMPEAQITPATRVAPSNPPPPAAEQSGPPIALVLSQPLRAGQIVYADAHRDAIALAAVNTGAELIADGNIHIYATLRGRALAGAGGNDQARIFCQRLEAELISIAGVYVSADELPRDKIGKPVQISQREGSLVITELPTR